MTVEQTGAEPEESGESAAERKLWLSFHGRVIDHLGIQMYQSPVAALAELVANAWDADAENVELTLPTTLAVANPVIVVKDDGVGMTFEECQQRYLAVGYNRRDLPDADRSPEKGRKVLGRKGIGKFAGFGIAEVIVVDTTSKQTGEHTVFRLDLRTIRGDGQDYTGGPIEIEVLAYEGPDRERRAAHGTEARLENLTLSRAPNGRLPRSMSRRFLLLQRVDDLQINVNGVAIPESEELENVEFFFPRDYEPGERPEGMTEEDGWGIEEVADGQRIRWQMLFYRDPVADQELSGVAVFANGKVAQLPFFFNLTGGTGSQWAQTYLSGRVEADYLDELGADLIATERQRIDWDAPEAAPLLDWGRERVQRLSRIWQERRAQAKRDALDQQISPLAPRLARLPEHEQSIVRRALRALVAAGQLPQEKFLEIGDAILTAWEGGRLKDLIAAVADADELPEADLLRLLIEANVLTALQTAEAVKVKLRVIQGLYERIERQELELAVRDYIAENPWLVSPEWDTYTIETRVGRVLEEAAQLSGIDREHDWNARVDLVLSSGSGLLVLEFMRPGVRVDWDHLNRFERYVLTIRNQLAGNTALGFTRVTGYLVADRLSADPTITEKLQALRAQDMYAMSWRTLLSSAAARWRDFFRVLVGRDPEDQRLRGLAADLEVPLGPDVADGVTADQDEEAAAAEEGATTPNTARPPD